MKKIVLIFAILTGALMAYAQDNTSVAPIVSKVNAKCPVTVTDGLTLKAVTVQADTIQFEYQLTDQLFDSMSTMKDILKDAMIAEFVSSPDPVNKELVAKCKSENLSIRQRFTDGKSKVVDILITPADLR